MKTNPDFISANLKYAIKEEVKILLSDLNGLIQDFEHNQQHDSLSEFLKVNLYGKKVILAGRELVEQEHSRL